MDNLELSYAITVNKIVLAYQIDFTTLALKGALEMHVLRSTTYSKLVQFLIQLFYLSPIVRGHDTK